MTGAIRSFTRKHGGKTLSEVGEVFGGAKTEFRRRVRGRRKGQVFPVRRSGESSERAKFIQSAIKHPGELRRFAEAHGAMHGSKICLDCVQREIDELPMGARRLHLQRALNLAVTLGKLRRHKS